MSEWKTTRIRDVAEVYDGPHATPKKVEKGPWYLSISSLRRGQLDLSKSVHISEVDFPKWTRRVAPQVGDTLFSYETRLGQAAYWALEAEAALGRRMGLLRPKRGLIEPRYLCYAYLGPQFQEVIRQHTLSGATVDRIPVGEMPNWPILLPSLETQRAVLSVLNSIDGLIENNRRRIEVLEEMARAIYREWFVKFRFPGHQDVRLVDSSMGRIPEGWTARTLNGIVSVQSAGVEPASLSPETPAIGLEHIPRRQITLDNWGTAANQGSRKSRFQRGDVLFGKIRPYFHKVSVAPVSGICSTDAIVLRPDAVNWGQAVLTISSDSFVVHAAQTSNGTKMPRADWKVLGKWQVAVPPAELAGEFTALVRDQLALAETLMFENRRLVELRDRLLPKLVTGQIDVSGLNLEAADAKEEAG